MIISLQTFSLSILQPIVSLTDVYNKELQNYLEKRDGAKTEFKCYF